MGHRIFHQRLDKKAWNQIVLYVRIFQRHFIGKLVLVSAFLQIQIKLHNFQFFLYLDLNLFFPEDLALHQLGKCIQTVVNLLVSRIFAFRLSMARMLN